MLDFSSVFITRCELLMALICLVIDLSRLDSDRVSDLIEIKNALLDLVEMMGKLLCVPWRRAVSPVALGLRTQRNAEPPGRRQ